jgi:hypothetical protein
LRPGEGQNLRHGGSERYARTEREVSAKLSRVHCCEIPHLRRTYARFLASLDVSIRRRHCPMPAEGDNLGAPVAPIVVPFNVPSAPVAAVEFYRASVASRLISLVSALMK